MGLIKKLTDLRNPRSFINRLRRRRIESFVKLLEQDDRPLKILDIGGTQIFWEMMGFLSKTEDIEIWILNLEVEQSKHKNLKMIVGDARDIAEFKDKEFDIVFSNSVIEHLTTVADQHRMANEVKRLGKKYYIQTPNKYFPIEPHFLFPFFQFLPLSIQLLLVTHFKAARGKNIKNRQIAKERITGIRLLTRGEIKELFPEANISKEKLLGLTKSFIVTYGWDL